MTGKVPLIAITGFLGAGKTSLLNHLLRAPGARLGVVVNDFGTINVDAALVSGQIDEASTISGGCLCCLPDAGGLDDALAKLSQPKLRLDAILVEASGAADPLALDRIIRFSKVPRIRAAGIVEVIDAVEHFRTVDRVPELPLRYAVASLIVIGKTDLLSEHEREATIRAIRERVLERNPGAAIVIARAGQIDPALVFDTATEEDPLDELPIAQLLREAAVEHTHHDHARAASVALTEPVSPSALVDLLEQPPAGAYRIKGRIGVRRGESVHGFLVNVVGGTIHVTRLADARVEGELVAIGMELDQAATERRLENVARASTEEPDTAGFERLQRYRRLSS
ncbi:cobalamin biosynthesis protein CobW [Gulosibacter molinativorax]|uniref:Cobalamin biosynthesis protein CobW n=1 Tax=Gulosibacter molinativorax TaxID=256821 RepID=A0ABT7C9B2_9MICO|nr:cobalamin biosynthesis protein CobW [Gulosibacter molinativorax]